MRILKNITEKRVSNFFHFLKSKRKDMEVFLLSDDSTITLNYYHPITNELIATFMIIRHQSLFDVIEMH